MKTRIVLLLSLLMLVAGCSSPGDGNKKTGSGGVGFDAYPDINVSEAELTEGADLVVKAVVLSREVLNIRDDPYLPPVENKDQRLLVEGGHRRVKWTVRVEETLKGTSTDQLFLVAGLGGSDEVGFESDSGGELTPEFAAIEPNRRYTFWLTEDGWFKQNHWIMNRAVPFP